MLDEQKKANEHHRNDLDCSCCWNGNLQSSPAATICEVMRAVSKSLFPKRYDSSGMLSVALDERLIWINADRPLAGITKAAGHNAQIARSEGLLMLAANSQRRVGTARP
jgi:hypothetical protein